MKQIKKITQRNEKTRFGSLTLALHAIEFNTKLLSVQKKKKRGKKKTLKLK